MMPATQINNGIPAGSYNSAPSIAPGNLAQGDAGTSSATQGLLNNQVNKAFGNDTSSLMEGVPSAASGLLNHTVSDTSLGGGVDPSDFSETMKRANESAVGNTANQIQSYLSATAPLRQAQYESDAAGNLAKVSQLDMNDYMLYNQQQLQQLQLQQAQAAAQQSLLGSILGFIGAGVGAGVGAIVGGPAGAVTGAAIGGKI